MMFDVLRFKADAAASRVGAALVLTPARRVALVFPLGQPVAIADAETLRALAQRASAVRKHITIIGGDALLRASAVIAGLPAATTVEEWRGAGRVRTENGSARVMSQRESARLFALAEVDEGAGGEWEDDPLPLDWEPDAPDYLLRLLPLDRSDSEGTLSGDIVETPSGGRLRTLPPPSDAAAFEAANVASERDEEGISDTIRETSGLRFESSLSGWLPLTSRAAGDGDFGEAHRP